MIDFLIELCESAQDWYERNSWAIFPAYIIFLSLELFLSNHGFHSIGFVLGLWLFGYFIRKLIHPAIDTCLGTIGTLIGIKNKSETIEEDIKKISMGYYIKITLIGALIFLFPPLVLKFFPFRENSEWFLPLVTTCFILAAIMWHTDGKRIRWILKWSAISVLTLIIGILINATFLRGLGLNFSLPSSWVVNSANADLEQAEQKRLDEHREKTIAYIKNRLAEGAVTETDAKAYNDLMLETHSRKRLVYSPGKKSYVLTELPSAVTKIIQKGENFFEG